MIKFSIQGQKDECKEPVQELRLGLRLEDEMARVVILGEDGDVDLYLLEIKSDGTFCRYEGLPEGIGLQVNDDGQIKESE